MIISLTNLAQNSSIYNYNWTSILFLSLTHFDTSTKITENIYNNFLNDFTRPSQNSCLTCEINFIFNVMYTIKYPSHIYTMRFTQ